MASFHFSSRKRPFEETSLARCRDGEVEQEQDEFGYNIKDYEQLSQATDIEEDNFIELSQETDKRAAEQSEIASSAASSSQTISETMASFVSIFLDPDANEPFFHCIIGHLEPTPSTIKGIYRVNRKWAKAVVGPRQWRRMQESMGHFSTLDPAASPSEDILSYYVEQTEANIDKQVSFRRIIAFVKPNPEGVTRDGLFYWRLCSLYAAHRSFQIKREDDLGRLHRASSSQGFAAASSSLPEQSIEGIIFPETALNCAQDELREFFTPMASPELAVGVPPREPDDLMPSVKTTFLAECLDRFPVEHHGARDAALRILDIYGARQNDFWAVVSTIALCCHTAEEMIPVFLWAFKVAPELHPWYEARHELPCLLFMLLATPATDVATAGTAGNATAVASYVRAATKGLQAEIGRCIVAFSNPAVTCSASGVSTTREATPEQAVVIGHDTVARATASVAGGGACSSTIQGGCRAVVKAFAGTGKTYTLLKQIEALDARKADDERSSSVYLVAVFNKPAKLDLHSRVPSYLRDRVVVNTLDAFVMKHFKLHRLYCFGCSNRKINQNDHIENVNTELVKKSLFNDLPTCRGRHGFEPTPKVATLVAKILNNFLYSNSAAISVPPYIYKDFEAYQADYLKRKGRPLQMFVNGKQITSVDWKHYAIELWNIIASPKRQETINYAVFTKVLQLRTHFLNEEGTQKDLSTDPTSTSVGWTIDFLKTVPALNLGSSFAQVSLDEAQDLSECQYDLLVRQQAKVDVFMFGDPYQAINGFRGAGSSVFTLPENTIGASVFSLTRSHRFGGRIAEDASSYLRSIYRGYHRRRCEDFTPLVGRGFKGGRVLSCAAWVEVICSASRGEDHVLILTRTNIGIVREALKVANILLANGSMKSIALLSKTNLNNFCNKILVLVKLFMEPTGTVTALEMTSVELKYNGSVLSFNSVVAWADDEENDELMSECRFAEELAGTVTEWIELKERFDTLLERCEKVTEISTALQDISISNTHQRKGLEYNTIIAGEDFHPLISDDGVVKSNDYLNDASNLVYVCMSRSKKCLVLNKTLTELIFKHDRPSVLAPRLHDSSSLATCAGSTTSCEVESDDGGGGEVEGLASSTTHRCVWSAGEFAISVGRERHANGVVENTEAAEMKSRSCRCCSRCIAEHLSLTPQSAVEGLSGFWGLEVIPLPPQDEVLG